MKEDRRQLKNWIYLNFLFFEEELRTNYISTSIYSESEVQHEHIEALADFAKQMTEHLALAHCDVITKFYTERPEIAIDRLLNDKYGYKLDDISLGKLWHLNQD